MCFKNMSPQGPKLDFQSLLLCSSHVGFLQFCWLIGRVMRMVVQEDSLGLLTIIKGTCMYRRSRNHDLAMDFIPPSMSEFIYARDELVG